MYRRTEFIEEWYNQTIDLKLPLEKYVVLGRDLEYVFL
jgi:hypothetical protein